MSVTFLQIQAGVKPSGASSSLADAHCRAITQYGEKLKRESRCFGETSPFQHSNKIWKLWKCQTKTSGKRPRTGLTAILYHSQFHHQTFQSTSSLSGITSKYQLGCSDLKFQMQNKNLQKLKEYKCFTQKYLVRISTNSHQMKAPQKHVYHPYINSSSNTIMFFLLTSFPNWNHLT